MSDSTSVRDPNFVPGGTIGVIEQLDLIDARPITVAIVDGAGDQITSFGGGTQYTEGAVPPASPVGPTLLFEDTGFWKAISAANPLPVLASIDTTGLATSTKQDTGNTSLDSIDTKTPALGQALAASSVPVVLTAAQIATITPPAAITGYATSAKQDTLLTELQLKADLTETQPVLDTNSAAIKTAVELIDNAISGAGFNTTQLGGVNISLNTGVRDTGTQRVTIATNDVVPVSQSGTWDEVGINDSGNSITVDNGGTFLVQENGTQVQVDDAAFTPAASKIVMSGFEADEGSTDSVDEGDGGAARMTLDRKQIVTLQPHTTGGLTTAMFSGSDGSSILTNAAQVIKATAGQLYGYYIYNPNSAATFVHFYNTAAASVTVGTTNPLFTLTIPATAAANLNIAQGILFSNAGWSISATTTAGGNTAPSTGLDAIVWYM